MKKFKLTLTEQGDLRAFEIRAYIELEADSLQDLFMKLVPEVAKVYQLKLDDAVIGERLKAERTALDV